MTTCLPVRLPAVPRLHRLAVVLGAAALLGTAAPAAAAPESPKLVVVIYPDESDGAPGTVLVNRAIRSTCAAEAPGRVEVRNEYISTFRAWEGDSKQAQVALLRRKYAGRKIDLVIAGMAPGLDFVLEHRGELFPGVPVVHMVVDEREVKARHLPPDVIGVPIKMDMAATLDLALRLHPDTRRVFVVAGAAPHEARWETEARQTFAPFEGRAEFTFLVGLPMSDLLARVADLPPHSLIYYLHIHQDGAGTPLIPAEALERLADRANAPVYGHVDTYVGRGAVGGRVFSFEAEGTAAARLGLRILSGEKPQAIPTPELSTNSYLFDSRELRRWGVSEASLPPGSVVRYNVPTLWDEYKWHAVGAAALGIVQALLIVALLVQLVKRRRAESRFRQVVETAPTGILMVARDGTIALVNAEVEALFGYTRGELLGRSVEMLLPEGGRSDHSAERARFFAAPGVRPAGQGTELLGRRKDGSEFPIEVGLSPLRTPRGLFALASIVDLTARRQAEEGLRASRQELQRLTGRLLESQEAERRRIARELHDDLNQSLALVSIELDALASAPEAPGGVRRVRELAEQVRELSSAVHELSHQLHPSKLEHLGLVTAVRSLCTELGHGHGLEVTFTHDAVPDRLPRDTALCLYRIAQEALRNVFKHSGIRRAAVELSGSVGAVRLRVTDQGRGFDLGAAGGGLGLVSMRERLNLVGGEMVVDSRPSRGTRIEVVVPVSNTEPAEASTARCPQEVAS